MINLNKFRSIKTKLFVSYFMLFLLFIIAMGVVSFKMISDNYQKNTLTQYSHSLDTQASLLAQWTEQNINTLLIYSKTDILKRHTADNILKTLSDQDSLEYSAFDYFAIVDSNKNIQLTYTNKVYHLTKPETLSHLSHSLNSPYAISNLLEAHSDGSEIIAFSVPLSNEDTDIIALSGIINKDNFDQLIHNHQPDKKDLRHDTIDNTETFLIDYNGKIISRSDHKTATHMDPLDISSIIEANQDNRNFSPLILEIGDFTYIYTSVSDKTSWILVTRVPNTSFVEQLVLEKQTVFFVLIIFILVGYHVSTEMSKRLAIPIIELTNNFEDAANGNLYATASIKTNDEIALAGKSFNKMMQQFRIMTYYDSLTDLSNYKYFVEQLSNILSTTKGDHDEIAIVRLGIDRFRSYNNALGIKVGDKILKSVAESIESTLGSRRHLSRVAGDEFAFILTGKNVTKKAITMIEYINKQLQSGIPVDASNIYITVSSGVSTYPAHGDSPETLISNAGIAMTIAKSTGLGDYTIYKEEQGALSTKYVSIGNDIKSAIMNNEFYLVYQPIKELHSNRYTSMETLVRWDHKDLGPLSPELFIRLAEENGMIIELGYWIMEQAIKDFSEMLPNMEISMMLAINISPLQLVSYHFVNNLYSLIEKYGVDPSLIVLEITERVLIDSNHEVISILNNIKEIGCKISLDDFGTGYSSLNYLYRYPFDIMKIDKSFIDDIQISNSKQKLVKGMIQIASNLDFLIIAEGVETKDQADFLSQAGCTKIQGYYYSRPLLKPALGDFLALHNIPLAPMETMPVKTLTIS